MWMPAQTPKRGISNNAVIFNLYDCACVFMAHCVSDKNHTLPTIWRIPRLHIIRAHRPTDGGKWREETIYYLLD